MSAFKPVLNEDNSISCSLGIHIKLNQVFEDGSRSELILIEAEEENVFYGLFDVEDTDFELIVNNRSDEQNIGFEVKLPNYSPKIANKYCLRRGQSLIVKEMNGKPLHFISPETDEGIYQMALCAQKDRITISYKEAAIFCSRIEFSVDVGKPEDIPKRSGVIFVRNLKGKTFEVKVSKKCTIAELKDLIEAQEGIPPEKQRIILGSLKIHSLPEDQTLEGAGIQSESTLYLLNISGRGSTLPRKSHEKTGQPFATVPRELKFIVELGMKPK